jgi:stearoyl-CoA desaturase (delta-9 desaturase)
METTALSTSEPEPVEILHPSRFWERVSFCVFWGIHLSCLAALVTGVSLRAAVIAVVLYWTRMFVITAGYHRYFSHRTYRTSRFFQFLLGLFGTTCVQKGPIWWAATHRRHHKHSDEPEDVHSPRQRGFWHSHVGWIISKEFVATDVRTVRDLQRYPELRWLGTWHWVAPVTLAFLCWLAAGWSGLFVGFGWSTVVLWHGTFTINSLAHVFGKRRYPTGDDSRNNWLLAIITMGEGWHNNHHHYMGATRQGFFWWEVDGSYYLLRLLAMVGLVWDLKEPPAHVLAPPVAAAAPSTGPELPPVADAA